MTAIVATYTPNRNGHETLSISRRRACKGDAVNSTTPGEFDVPGIAAPPSQEPARLIVAPPLPDALARGLVVIQYRAENLRIFPVYGPAALQVKPRIGHIHVTVDDSPWHWVDASGEPLIIQSLPAGPHRVLIELADPTHHVIDRQIVSFEIPPRS
jgi:hypothetical protein